MKNKLRYWWTLLYFIIYLICFFFIEHFLPVKHYHIISTPLDHMIPFNEWFIFLYISWFGYIFFSFWYFFFKDKKEYLQMMTYLFTGMTLFVIVSILYPNGLDIRPHHLDNSNIALILVNALYKIDTPTNVLPSIHIFNSIGMCLAFYESKHSTKHLRIGVTLLTIGITLSTFFLKQHGIIDAISAMILAVILYVIVYKKEIYLFKKRA